MGDKLRVGLKILLGGLDRSHEELPLAYRLFAFFTRPVIFLAILIFLLFYFVGCAYQRRALDCERLPPEHQDACPEDLLPQSPEFDSLVRPD